MADATGHRGAAPYARPLPIYRAVVTVSNAADTVLSDTTVPGWSGRVYSIVQVQGAGSAVMYCRAATSASGGVLLSAGTPGGAAEDGAGVGSPYTGAVSLRAVSAPVDVFVEAF